MEHRVSRIALAAAFMVAAAAAQAAEDPHIAKAEADLEPLMQVKGAPVVRHTLAEEMATHHIPAVSIAVVDGGRIVWAKAYGMADVAAGVKATTATVFQAGSVSKPVAASAAMQLIQQGKLRLDVPANDQLKSWKIPDSPFTKETPVTLRHLLTHTGGLTVHGFPGYAQGAPVPTVVQVLDGKAPANTPAVVVDRKPGTAWNYSGGGITIAQLMMTEASGQAFPALLKTHVFAPLGMTSSTYEQPLPATRTDGAAGYLFDGKPVVGRFHTYPEMAAAGLWTTPTDLAKWAIALQQAYDGKSTRLMSQASARTMLTPGLGNWGIGIEIDGAGDPDALRFTHGGDDWGFKANLVGYMKGGRGVAVMANGDDGTVVIMELTAAVARAYGWKGFEPRMIDAKPLGDANRAAIAGSYGKGVLVIGAGDPTMLEVRQGPRKFGAIPLGGDRFQITNGDLVITILRGPDGKVRALSLPSGVELARDP